MISIKKVAALTALAFVACKQPAPPPPNPPPPDPPPGDCTPSLTMGTPLRMLTRAEYNNTVRDLLGDTTGPAKDFPREPLAHGLDNDWSLVQPSNDGVSRYLEAAEALSSDTMKNRRARVVPCNTNDANCAARFIDEFGLRAWRRPLSADEKASMNMLFSSIQTANDFDTAVELSLQVFLQSPQFLFRDEQALGPVPMPRVQLSAFELATRLSYFLWATTPDDALLTAASSGKLDTPEGLSAEAKRMLADPRAMDGLMRFFALWLELDAVGNTEKDVTTYPQFNPALAKAWRTSLELFVRDVLEKDGTLTGLLSSPVMFTNDSMNMYGPSAPTPDFVRNEMPGTQRRGLLTQPGFLAYKSQPNGSSPVRRGIFVLDKLVCQPPPPPPAGAAITPPQPSTSLTTRERFKNHSTSPACYGCHQFIDPVGFTFEHYDGLGLWRDTENGQTIDSTGGIIAAADGALVSPVNGVSELAEKLSSSRQVHECVGKELYRFALGRQLTEADSCTVTLLMDRFMATKGNFKELMLAIVESEAFRANANPEMTP